VRILYDIPSPTFGKAVRPIVKISRIAGIALGASLASVSFAGIAYAISSDTVTCGGITSCVAGTNTGNGNGVLGTNTGTGYGVLGRAGGFQTAVAGIATSGIGVSGQAGAIGVSGQGGTYGVYAYSPNGTGAYGAASATSDGVSALGVNGPGVLAESDNGTALQALSNDAVAVSGEAYKGGNGVVGISGSGVGIGAFAGYSGVIANGGSTGVVGVSDSFPFVGTDAEGNTDFFVDSAGDVFASNGILCGQAGGQGVRNQRARAYTPKKTTPMLEDTGTGHLANGVARVAFNSSFADAIDGRTRYHVFVTPSGDTRGLYVTDKSPRGFVVRESQLGHSSLDFDYRVVATIFGHAGERSRVIDESRFLPNIRRPTIPAIERRAITRPKGN